MQPKSLSILVVEDDPVNLQVLELMLASFGHAVLPVGSAREALAALAQRSFDVVLTDLHMPDMGGEALLRAIRSSTDAAPPVVVVTADVMSHRPEHYLKQGFAGFLSKPLSAAALTQALERLTLGLPALAGRLPLRRAG